MTEMPVSTDAEIQPTRNAFLQVNVRSMSRLILGYRKIRFALVGGTCFLIQAALLYGLSDMGMRVWLANGLAFLASAQINFVLSQSFTFGDRQTASTQCNKMQRAKESALYLGAYNAAAAASLGVNEVAFIAIHAVIPTLLAAVMAATLVSLSFNYVVLDRLVFANRKSPVPDPTAAETERGWPVTTATSLEELVPQAPSDLPSVAVVMPAYKEAENLAATVRTFLNVFEANGIDGRLVIVNDGSPDRTGEIAEELEFEYPGKVFVAHHTDGHGNPMNRGYGAAVITAYEVACQLDPLPDVIHTTDSDGQFKGREVVDFLRAFVDRRADAVIGYRRHRADGRLRKLTGLLWTIFSMLVLRFWARDVDCAAKAVRTKFYLEHLDLHGDAAAISPEVIAQLKAGKALLVTLPVEHYARENGHNGGLDIAVVLRSFSSVVKVWWGLVKNRKRLSRIQRLVRPYDWRAYIVTLTAAIASAIAFAWYYTGGQTMLYPDAISHLLISRRVLYSPTPGLAQLGGVWLPGAHVLALPFVAFGSLFHDGIAGSIVSMAAFVITARFIYKTAALLTGKTWPGFVAAAVFIANANALYLQSTAMEEVPLYACISAAVFYALRYGMSRRWQDVAAMSLTAALGTLIRYEGWVIALALMGYVAYVNLLSWKGRHRLYQDARLFAMLGLSGIALWIGWNWVIFKDPLFWATGKYARPSLWTNRSDVAIGHWMVSAKTYWYATVDILGLPATILMIAGLGLFVARTRLRPRTAAPLVLFTLPAFFIYSLKTGQRPLHVQQISHELYNVRFALVMVIPAAIMIAYGADTASVALRKLRFTRWTSRQLVARAAVTAALAAVIVLGQIVVPTTLVEGQRFSNSALNRSNLAAARYLHQHYDSGLVLIEDFGNEVPTFYSEIPTERMIYEGSNYHDLWKDALVSPKGVHVRWIYMRRTVGNTDDVWAALHASPALAGYHRVYQDADRVIYLTGAAKPSKPAIHRVAVKQIAAQSIRPAKIVSVSDIRPAPRPKTVSTTGIVSWFYGPAGSCYSTAVAVGKVMKLTNPTTGAQLSCHVVGYGPEFPGRIVNLAMADFAHLAPPDQGLVKLIVSG